VLQHHPIEASRRVAMTKAWPWCLPACLLIVAGCTGVQRSQRTPPREPASEVPPVAVERLRFEPGDYFRIEQENGRWWFVTPEGGAFLSFGVNHVTWHGDRVKGTDQKPYMEAVLAKYGTKEKWAQTASERLESWGYNTIGAWSVEEVNPYLPRTPILNLTNGYWKACWKEGHVPDFFSSEFDTYVAERAQAVEKHVGDPKVLGYFIDNELGWAPDHRNRPELFDGYAALPADAPGKQKLVAFMQQRHQTVAAFNRVWKPKLTDWTALAQASKLSPRNRKQAKADREAFTLAVARRYFEVTTGAIRSRDPQRLVLGCRFMPYTVPKVVVQACGEYCDVISINFYEQLWGAKIYFAWKPSSIDRMPQGMDLSAFYQVGRKPLMVTEFTSRLKAKGHNSYPPPYAIQPVVKTQRQRVARYEKQVMSWLPQPWCIGAHWFEHADQPKEGRAGDGENCIFGLVTVRDEPYEKFVEGVAEVNRKAASAHATSTASDHLNP